MEKYRILDNIEDAYQTLQLKRRKVKCREICNEKTDTNLENNRLTTTSYIHSSNVNQLKIAWVLPTKMPVSSEPLIFFDYLYFTDWEGYAYCVRKTSGVIVWKTKLCITPNVDECKKIEKYNALNICPPYTYQGLAATGVIVNDFWIIGNAGGTIGLPFENGKSGKVYAVDRRTGRIIWSKEVTDYEYGGVYGRLIAHEGKVFVGVSSVDGPALRLAKQFNVAFTSKGKGKVVALDLATGEKLWEKQVIGLKPNDNLEAVGGAIWASFSIDPKTNTLFTITGNNYTSEMSNSSESIIALDLNTGQLKWQNQVFNGKTAINQKDDFGGGPQLFTTNEKLVGAGNKDGYYYAFNRDTGDLVWSSKLFVKDSSGIGVHNEASIYNNVLYTWSNNGFKDSDPKDPREFPITVAAIDTYTGYPIWTKTEQPANLNSSGILSNDLYFVGDLTGSIYAYHTLTGLIVKRIQLYNTSITSSIQIDRNFLYVGCGLPGVFGGSSMNYGLYALCI